MPPRLTALRRRRDAWGRPHPAREDRAGLGHHGKQRMAGVSALGRSPAVMRGACLLLPPRRDSPSPAGLERLPSASVAAAFLVGLLLHAEVLFADNLAAYGAGQFLHRFHAL